MPLPRTATEISRNFAVNMRAARLARGWSLARMADELAMRGHRLAVPAIWKSEARARTVTIAEAVAVASIFGVTVDYMACDVHEWGD